MRAKYILFLSVLILSACGDFLDVVPKDKQTETQLFATRGGYYTAINGIYNSIASETLYGRNLSYQFIDILGKRYAYPSNSEHNLYYLALMNSNFSHDNVRVELDKMWRTAYRTIINCNVIIDNIAKGTDVLTPAEQSLITGEMLAVRAFLHLDMLRLFGPLYPLNPERQAIPYNEWPLPTALPLLPADSVLKYKIIRDLELAESLMKDTDPVISDGPTTEVPDYEKPYLYYRQLRLNYYAVKTLKARAYLYAGDKENALSEALALIEDPLLQAHFPPVDPATLLANTLNPDRVFSSEVLWGMYRKDRSEIHKLNFDLETAGIQNFLHPKDYITSSIFSGATEDYRFQSQWQASGSTGHDLIKFKAIAKPDPDDNELEYFFATLMSLVRIAEIYYIAAESEPDVSDGYGWLNVMRNRRGLQNLPVSTPDNLMAELRKEYIREFAGEGQVFFLYKRLAFAMPSAENGSTNNTVPATDANYVPPLPQSETDNR